MYSTIKNIVYKPPKINEHSSIGCYLQFPNKTTKRKLEGGMRLAGKYKKNYSNKPLVSIVTTVYNRELVFEKALCSVLMQSYDNIEYIIVDGNSSDGTINIINKYADVIDYYISEPDKGIYEGMNKGLQLAQGQYIILLNSDDWYEPNCIQILVESSITNNLDITCALAIETDSKGNSLRKIPMMPFGNNIRFRMPLRHETMLISKTLYNKVGLYDETYKIIGDLKLTQKFYNNMKGFKQLNEYVMYFRKMGAAKTLTLEFIDERKRLLKEQFSFLTEKEITLLSNEYQGNIKPYKDISTKYTQHKTFINGFRAFMSLLNIKI